MKTVVKKVKTVSGREVKVTSNQFTDEELAKMPPSHRKFILGMRELAMDSIRMRE